ncbi:hypothetical protein DK926_21660 [Rhodococcus sp. Eu-32]|uniref:T3SS (YopN, CesT) and YbjN peptide-binding chaperone 1 n=1 Tax=Rhodococcus sp. Eu-32 TaxID=1017319 RepID=UPI000DF280FC|nr:hypothetical protein [Rhodococcus sp. Eu-32]RRQ25684.1 hypothetical protein DK926_21660 [Rhodococcus sp. Eu-32]
MSTFDGLDLDEATGKDWGAFTRRLADRLAHGTAEITLCPAFVPDDRRRPTMTFRRTPSDTIACTTTALSAPVPPWAHDAESSTNVVEKPAAWADHLAYLAVGEIRTVWGVTHPAFLDGDEDSRGAEAYDPTTAVTTDREDELERVVLRCLRNVTGLDVELSADKSVAIMLGLVTAYVYVAGPTEVRIHAPVVERISGRTRAAELVADLNRRHSRLKFLLVDDRVHVAASVDAQPLVPRHLDAAFHRLAEFVMRVDASFADHLGGVVAYTGPDPRPEPDFTASDDDAHHDADCDVPPDLLALLELDSAAEGAVDVELVVSVCGQDRTKIAGYEAFCSDQARSWRECALEAEERGDTDAMDEYEAEAVPWDRIVATLRLTLRTAAFFDNA